MGRWWTGYTSISAGRAGIAHSHGEPWRFAAAWRLQPSYGYGLWKTKIPSEKMCCIAAYGGAGCEGNGAPWKSLREIPQDLCTRMIAPHIGRQQGDGNRGDRGGRQVVRKIALKTLCIVHDGFGAIRQRVVEIEENRLQHNMFLHYGYQLSNLTVKPSGSTKV